MVSVIIPTYKGRGQIERLLPILKKSPDVNEIILISSSSSDSEVASSLGVKIIEIKEHSFEHGNTRTLGGISANGNIIVYLTQDALPVNENSIKNLIKPLLDNEEVVATYGRQLPYPDASPFAAHLRMFNYPPESSIKSLRDKETFGIKAMFMSNSFAAYKKSALEKVGWFKKGIIMGEDTYVVAKLLLADYKIAYVSDAIVYHSHNYSAFQEFKRYFDIGVFHAGEKWILEQFGRVEGEGMRYVRSELKYLWKENPLLIPSAILRTILKLIAYKLGTIEQYIPIWLKRRLSMHRRFWDTDHR